MKIKLATRISDLLFLTRELDLWFIFIWLIYAGWGWAAFAAGLPTLQNALGATFNEIWALSVAIAGTIAAVAATSLFFQVPHFNQIRKKKIELSAVGAILFLAAIYPVYLGILAAGGDTGRVASTILALLYPLIPFIRIRILLFRVRNMRNATR